MDAKVGVGVKVVVPRRHLLGADEFGALASGGTGALRGGAAGRVLALVVGGRHWFGRAGRLGRLGEVGGDDLVPLEIAAENILKKNSTYSKKKSILYAYKFYIFFSKCKNIKCHT